MSDRAVLALALAIAAGCQSPPPSRRERPPLPEGAHVEEVSPDAPAPPSAPALAEPPPPSEDALAAAPRLIERAAATDTAYDDDEPVTARRYVYRVRLALPDVVGTDHSDLAIPAAELFVDVSAERLRARFAGPGWPVEAGSEVRIRGDSPGVYVFDARGGRPLEPGALATWFEGGAPRRGPMLVVRREVGRRPEPDPPPGGLICALLSEWAGEPRDGVARRCDQGAPTGFRVGFWRGERTAEVPVELPRRALRADDVDPPPPAGLSSSRAFLEPAAFARIPPMERPPPADEVMAPPREIGEGLELENQSEARAIVTVEGVAIGWVASGARGLFIGLRPGAYRVGAMRPLGAVVMRPRVVMVPGSTLLRPRRVAPE